MAAIIRPPKANGIYGLRAYIAFLSPVLVTGVVLGDRLLVSGARGPRNIHVAIFISIVILAGLLLPLVRRTNLYAAGLACTLLALTAFWFSSPRGSSWATGAFNNPNFMSTTATALGLVSLLAFPVGWLLLAGSIRRWLEGVVAYFAVGWLVIGALNLTFAPVPLSMAIRLMLFWPHFVLRMFGAFGWTLN